MHPMGCPGSWNQGTFAREASRPLANLHHVPGPGKIPNESSTTTATL